MSTVENEKLKISCLLGEASSSQSVGSQAKLLRMKRFEVPKKTAKKFQVERKKYIESQRNKFSVKRFLAYYVKNCTVHGLKYISESDHWFTR